MGRLKNKWVPYITNGFYSTLQPLANSVLYCRRFDVVFQSHTADCSDSAMGKRRHNCKT